MKTYKLTREQSLSWRTNQPLILDSEGEVLREMHPQEVRASSDLMRTHRALQGSWAADIKIGRHQSRVIVERKTVGHGAVTVPITVTKVGDYKGNSPPAAKDCLPTISFREYLKAELLKAHGGLEEVRIRDTSGRILTIVRPDLRIIQRAIKANCPPESCVCQQLHPPRGEHHQSCKFYDPALHSPGIRKLKSVDDVEGHASVDVFDPYINFPAISGCKCEKWKQREEGFHHPYCSEFQRWQANNPGVRPPGAIKEKEDEIEAPYFQELQLRPDGEFETATPKTPKEILGRYGKKERNPEWEAMTSKAGTLETSVLAVPAEEEPVTQPDIPSKLEADLIDEPYSLDPSVPMYLMSLPGGKVLRVATRDEIELANYQNPGMPIVDLGIDGRKEIYGLIEQQDAESKA